MPRKPPDNRVGQMLSGIPSGYLIGRLEKGEGKAHLIGPDELRRFLGPGFIQAVASSGSTITVQEEGVTTSAVVTTMNFVGAGVTATGAAATATITVVIDETTIALTDITTNNSSTSKHGFLKKLPNVATQFMDGTGNWTVPAGSGLSATLTSAHIFVGNGSNVATDVAVSGDVTLANTGAVTIANDAVTFAKMQNASAASILVGRGAGAGGGDFQEITLGTNISMTGTVLSAVSGGGSSVDISPFSDGNITKPAAADFTIADDTTTNHGVGSKADLATRGVALTHTQAATPISSQTLFFQAAVSNTLVSMTAYLAPNFGDRNSNWFYGLGVRDNTGKIHAFGIRNNATTLAIYSDFRYTTISSFSTAVNQTGGTFALGRPLWMRLAKVSTNFVFSISLDGENYFTVETISATTFVGATLNDVGIFVVNNLGVASAPLTVDCFSFIRT